MTKLMLLGGNRYQLPVIRAAHELGFHVITCDYLPDNIAHKYSDEYHDVSIVDKEAVLKVAYDLDVGGIMSFGCDPGVTTAAYVAEELGLPSVGSFEAVSILQNKGQFRRYLAANGFRVPVAKSFKRYEDVRLSTDIFHWPVIIKPTDSAGSKGVTRVDNPECLEKAFDYAKRNSIGGEVIIEDFLEKVGCSSDTDSFSVNGELRFASFNAQRFDDTAANPYAPAAYSWPSTMGKKHEDELQSEIQRLISLLGLRTSIYNIETRVCTDGNAYIMECSPRGGGNRLAEVLRYATGVDLVKASVMAAVGREVVGIEQKPYNGSWAEVILHSDTPGAFKRLWVDKAIQENVVEEDLWVKPGDIVNRFAAANEAIGTLIMRFDDEERMNEIVDNVKRFIRVKCN